VSLFILLAGDCADQPASCPSDIPFLTCAALGSGFAFGVRCRVRGRGWFPSTLPVLDNRLGVIRNVSNANQAADVLLHRWPPNPGKSHLAARRAVLEAL